MNVMICLDDSKGMLFNKRRQTRDKRIHQRLEELCAGRSLWMNSYSAGLYGSLNNVNVLVDEEFLIKARKGDFCFVESDHLKPVENNIEGLILFWWNRKYPGDFYLDLNLAKWQKLSSEDFVGASHEKITQEVYVRK